MKKHIMVAALLALLVIALAGVSQAGQERMGLIGDAYGLLQDESDFLTHYSQIAQGEGIRLYGYYRFTYMDVMDWDDDLDLLDAPRYFHLDTSGANNYATYDLMSELDAFAQRQSIEVPQGDFNPWGNENRQQISDERGKDPVANVLKLLQTNKARIEWSTGRGVSVLFDL